VGAQGLRLPGHHRAAASPTSSATTARRTGLLAVELAAEDVDAIAEAGHAQVDLAAQEVRWEGGSASFDIDPEVKRRLLNGLDDISVTLEEQEDAISAFERERERSGPVTTALT
jgi:3-isopropylmalate/(R)-2-methylmalate dehydratase small subunit